MGEESKSYRFGLKKLFGWLIGIVSVIAGIGLIADGAVISGLATLAIPFFSIPMLANKWQNKYNFSLSTGMTALSVSALFVVIGITAPQDITASDNPNSNNVQVQNGQVVVDDENNSSTENEKQQQQDEENTLWNKSGFMLSAQDAVKNLLKAPATAEFPSRAEGVEVGVRGIDNLYRLDSYVDSENSFGANIRSEFIVEGVMKNGEPEKIIFVQLDGETVVDRRGELNTTAESS